jgi:acyl-coenzyme A thioesterase PaaI-like protein
MSEQAAPSPASEMIVYSYIGPTSELTSDVTAEGTLLLRDDLRHEGGLLAAPLCIMILDCAATNTTRLALSAPTRVDIDVFDTGAGVSSLRIRGAVTRHGRSQIFTEATIEDADDPSRIVAYGTTSFAVTGPPSVTKYTDHTAPGWAEGTVLPPLTEVFGGEPRDDGGFTIPTLTPAIGHKRLHSGVMQVLAEAAALNAVRARLDRAVPLRIGHLGTTVMTEGRQGPFTVVPTVLAVGGTVAACRVEVRDQGSDGRFVALITAAVQIGS